MRVILFFISMSLLNSNRAESADYRSDSSVESNRLLQSQLNRSVELAYESIDSHDSDPWAPKLAIDPLVSLEELDQASGKPIVRTESDQALNTHWADTSAIIRAVSVESLYLSSIDFDRYKEMKMPHLRNCKILERVNDKSWTIWNDMEAEVIPGLKLGNRHYMNVSLSAPYFDGSIKAAATVWSMISGLEGWPFKQEERPLFNRFSGSWFVQALDDQRVYVRYYLVGIPRVSAVLAPIIRAQFQNEVPLVIQALTEDAKSRTLPGR